MRMASAAPRLQPKNPMSAASKITRIVSDFFLPLADGYIPPYTPLTATPDAEETLLLERIWELFPESMKSRDDFVARMGELYDTRHDLAAEPSAEEEQAPAPDEPEQRPQSSAGSNKRQRKSRAKC